MDEISSGEKFEDSDDEEHDIKAWGNFKPHSNKASLQKVETAFFAQFSGNSSEPLASHYPAKWENQDIEAVLKHGRTLSGMSMLGQAAEMRLVNEDNQPVLKPDGEPIDLPLVLSEMRDMPPQEIKAQIAQEMEAQKSDNPLG